MHPTVSRPRENLGLVDIFVVEYNRHMTKTCPGCNRSLDVSEFTKNAARDDGLSVKCKACQKDYRVSKGLQKAPGWRRKTDDMAAYQKSWRKANVEKVRSYEKKKVYDPVSEKKKYERKMRRLKGEDYVVGAPGNRPKRADSELAKKKRTTRGLTKRAIKQGKLVRQPCQVCGVVEVEAHHTDYTKPLDVQWLCKQHHREVHLT